MLVTYGGAESFREPLEIDAEQFIGVKSFKAKGKRITTLTIEKVEELEPLRFPEPEEEVPATTAESEEAKPDPNEIMDEDTGQFKIQFDE
jgi:topoisomerase-4 subunit A